MITIKTDGEKSVIEISGKPIDLLVEASNINVSLICEILNKLELKEGTSDLVLARVNKDILEQYISEVYKCACKRLNLKE